jgi:hypothetical protein
MEPTDAADVPTASPPVTYAACTDCTHLAPLLLALAEGIERAPVPRDRIVLVVPDTVRDALGWATTATPRARVVGGVLVFLVG